MPGAARDSKLAATYRALLGKLSPTGRAVIFEPFEVGPMAVGTREVVIPRDRLSGYLLPSLPFLPFPIPAGVH
jgi:hypothetical protein